MIRFWPFRRLGLKLVSLVLATLLWIVVAGEQVVERALRIPLEFLNQPASLELVGEPPTVVDVRVRGSSGVLSRIAPGELVAVLDVRAARPGQRLFHLSGSDVRAPFGVEVVQVTPSSLSMTFEPSAQKTVPITVSVEGQPASGFAVGTVTAVPNTATVIGPASVVETLIEAITEPVSVAGASSEVVETVNAGVADPLARLRTPVSVRVTVTLVPAP
jgi:YbbR domain-containing protein